MYSMYKVRHYLNKNLYPATIATIYQEVILTLYLMYLFSVWFTNPLMVTSKSVSEVLEADRQTVQKCHNANKATFMKSQITHVAPKKT